MPKRGLQFRFGSFVLDCPSGELRKSGIPIHLEDQPFRLLAALVERQGEVVTREELKSALWSDETFVDFDRSLTRAINKVRTALGDSAANPRFIETLPRRGYRFVAPVSLVDPEHADKEDELSPEEGAHAPNPASSPTVGRSARPWLVLVAGVAVLGAAGSWRIAATRGRLAAAQEAERAYQKGIHLTRQRRLGAAREAVEEFRRALELQPGSARALAGLAEASSMIHPKEPKASIEMAERAVNLDSECGECQAVLGYLRFTKEWRWQDADRHLERAIQLQPHDTQIIYWSAQVQMIRGKPAKAQQILDGALQRNPELWNLHVLRAGCLYFLRNYLAALEAADKAIAVNLVAAWDWRSRALFLQGNHREAIRSLIFSLGAWTSRSDEQVSQRAVEMINRFDQSGLAGSLGHLLKQTDGQQARPVHAYSRANWQMLLGRREEALSELESGLARTSFDMIYVAHDPIFDPLRGDARFEAVLQKMGFH